MKFTPSLVAVTAALIFVEWVASMSIATANTTDTTHITTVGLTCPHWNVDSLSPQARFDVARAVETTFHTVHSSSSNLQTKPRVRVLATGTYASDRSSSSSQSQRRLRNNNNNKSDPSNSGISFTMMMTMMESADVQLRVAEWEAALQSALVLAPHDAALHQANDCRLDVLFNDDDEANDNDHHQTVSSSIMEDAARTSTSTRAEFALQCEPVDFTRLSASSKARVGQALQSSFNAVHAAWYGNGGSSSSSSSSSSLMITLADMDMITHDTPPYPQSSHRPTMMRLSGTVDLVYCIKDPKDPRWPYSRPGYSGTCRYYCPICLRNTDDDAITTTTTTTVSDPLLLNALQDLFAATLAQYDNDEHDESSSDFKNIGKCTIHMSV